MPSSHLSLVRRILQHAVTALLLVFTQTATADGFLGNPDVESFVSEMVVKHGLAERDLRDLLGRFDPHPAVLKAIKPAARTEQRAWNRYRAHFVNPRRINAGKAFLDEQANGLARAETRYGVPREIIAAIIGIETEYGRNTGRFNVAQALATLAFHYPPRAPFFRAELEALLLLARANTLDLTQLTGSYAGAIGIPQFMPSSLRDYAVDHDGDGRIDLRDSIEDAIGSVAAFLAAHGWAPGSPLVTPAYLPPDAPLQRWLAADIRPTLGVAELQANGVQTAGFPPAHLVALIDLVTPEQPTEYWWAWQNFYVVTRYNRSSFYAMSVIQLAQALGLR